MLQETFAFIECVCVRTGSKYKMYLLRVVIFKIEVQWHKRKSRGFCRKEQGVYGRWGGKLSAERLWAWVTGSPGVWVAGPVSTVLQEARALRSRILRTGLSQSKLKSLQVVLFSDMGLVTTPRNPNTKTISQTFLFCKRSQVWLKFSSVKTQQNLAVGLWCWLGFLYRGFPFRIYEWEGGCLVSPLCVNFIWIFSFRLLVVNFPSSFILFHYCSLWGLPGLWLTWRLHTWVYFARIKTRVDPRFPKYCSKWHGICR